MKDLGEKLRKAVQLEAKTRSVLATELRVSQAKVQQVAEGLISQELLEEVPGQDEPTYKYRLRSKAIGDKTRNPQGGS